LTFTVSELETSQGLPLRTDPWNYTLAATRLRS